MNYHFLFVGFCIFFIKNSLAEDLKFDSQKCSLYRELRNLELTKSDINTRKTLSKIKNNQKIIKYLVF